MTIGDLVKKYRAEHNLSQKEFGDRCNLSKGYISMLERNINPRNNRPIAPTIETLDQLASGMLMTLDELFDVLGTENVSLSTSRKSVKINVLGRVAAGIPMEAIENIIDEEEISQEMALTGEFFGLRITGRSMEPRMLDGDIVIVRKQEDVESGDVAIVLVNGNDATCKKVQKTPDGITLIPYNINYESKFFSNKEIAEKPVTIIGKVVELRGKF